MQKRSRFIGIRPFKPEEKDIFFGRERFVELICQSIEQNVFTVVHSEAGIGKTSIINAGVIPRLEQGSVYKFYNVSFPNFFKNSSSLPIQSVMNKLDTDLPENSYLDKIVGKQKTLWYKLKRIESATDKKILLIFDQFENIFSFAEADILDFKEQLTEAVFEQIPEEIRSEIDKKLAEEPDILTQEGFRKLFRTINLKILIVIRTDKLPKLDFFKDKIRGICENKIKIEAFDRQESKIIMQKTSSYKPKYNIDNLFKSEPFIISDNLLEEILDFLTEKDTKRVEAYQLQIIGKEIEKLSVNNMLSVVGTEQVSDLEGLYNDYYEAVINKIPDVIQRTSARKFVEDELVFEYERRKLTVYQGVAKLKYGLWDSTIDLLINSNIITKIKNSEDEIFYELSHDALITPLLMAKDKRIKYEIEIEKELKQKRLLEQKTEEQRKKNIRIRNFAILFGSLFIFTFLVLLYAIKLKNISEQRQKQASSSLYASKSFEVLAQDPTMAFRYAQKGYDIDKKNSVAVSAVLNSFYKTNIFYSENKKLAIKYENAKISGDGQLIALLSNSEHTISIVNLRGEILRVVPTRSIVSSVNFSKNDSLLIFSYYKGEVVVYDINRGIAHKYKQSSYTLFANLTVDNKAFVTCNSDKKAYLWSIDGRLLSQYGGHTEEVVYADFSPDDKKLVTVSPDLQVIVYNIDGTIISRYKFLLEYEFQSNDIQPVKFTPDGKNIVFAVNDPWHYVNLVLVWNYEKKKIIAKFNKIDAYINTISFLDDKNILVSTKKSKAYILNIAKGSYRVLAGHSDAVLDIAFDKKNKKVVTISTDGTIKTWKIYNTENKFKKFVNKKIVKYSKTGVYMVSVDYANNLTISNLTGDRIFSLSEKKILDIEFSVNDQYFAIQNAYNKIVIYKINGLECSQIETSDSIKKYNFDTKSFNLEIFTKHRYFEISPNGKKIRSLDIKKPVRLAIYSDNKLLYADKDTLFVYDMKTHKRDDYLFEGVKKILASASDFVLQQNYGVLVFDRQMRPLSQITSSSEISAVALSKTGQKIAVGTKNGRVSLYTNRGKKIIDFQLGGNIFYLQFSPNEKTVLVRYFDGNLLRLKEFLISPDEIIKYIDDLKLYGDVYSDFKLEQDFY